MFSYFSRYYQQTAGTLSFLLSSVLPKLVYPPDVEEIPLDLSPGFIKCLEWLMLAQAQECSWQLAKLSEQHQSVTLGHTHEAARSV